MPNPRGFAPLSLLIPLPDALRPLQDTGAFRLLDDVGLVDFKVIQDPGGWSTLDATLSLARQVSFGIPGLTGFSMALGAAGPAAASEFELQVPLKIPLSFTLAEVGVTLRMQQDVLVRAEKDKSGNWIPSVEQDGTQRPFEIRLSGLDITIDGDGDIDLHFDSTPTIILDPFLIGSSGVAVEVMKPAAVYLSRKTPPPPGHEPGFRGVHIPQARVYLPWIKTSDPNGIVLDDCFIGSGGFSGSLSADLALTGDLLGVAVSLKHVELEFVNNVPVQSEVLVELQLPFFDHPVNAELSINHDGSVVVALSAVQIPPTTMTNGLLTFEKSGILRMDLDSLGFELKSGVFLAKLSGKLTPLFADVNWPSFDVRELSIDSKGRVHLDGGWIPLPRSYSIDLFHVAKLEITRLGMGATDDGGKYIGMSGAVELVKGMPAGASVEGLRVAWYPDGTTRLSFNGIGVKLKTPAVEFDGHVSYTSADNAHQFKGDLRLTITACDLTLIGKAVVGVDKHGLKYFAIYVEGDFGTGIPLWATGLSLYGFAGLLAVNYAPDKPSDMLWYSVDRSKSWFHKPSVGVIDIDRKWKPEPGAFALGAGITLGTTTDDGYSFNGKFLLLLLCPGPVLMIDGSARFLGKRDDSSEPPFHGLIVLDNRAGYFLVGLDARWKYDKSQGNLADISGSMEAFFNYHDPTKWHLWLGKRNPIEQRIQARIGKVFTANTYFMLEAPSLALGVWIGTSNHYRWGPVKADMQAYLEADAFVNFKPSQVHVDIHLHGYLAVKVFKFRFGIGMDAILAADVFKPFHILGEINITIETRFKNFHIQLKLEWGPRHDPPDLGTLELAPVQSWGITHPKSSTEWKLSGPQALTSVPVVPVDCRPYVTFGYRMHDAIGVGVNPAPDPGWTIIGDPVSGRGSAEATYKLTNIELYRDGVLVAACPQPLNSNVDKIFGAWAPSIPGTSGGQNKLLLWALNPLDFADKAGSWNPWLSSNLPGYPCPDTSLETVCVDFQKVDMGRQLYGPWWDSQKLDFRFDWSDARPHPVAPVTPAIDTLDRGLLFAAPTARKRYRTYVANYNDNTVSLVDLVSRGIVTTIPAGAHPTQVVLSPDAKRAYVSNQDDNTLIVIDTATNLRVGAPIAVVKAPVSIAITADGKRAFAPSGVDPAMSVIDLHSLQVTATVNLPAAASQAVLSPAGAKLYIVHGAAGKISIFTPDSLALLKTVTAAKSTITGLFNTGVDSHGAGLANGAIDPHYIRLEGLQDRQPAFVVIDGQAPFPPWLPNSGASKWIGPVADQHSASTLPGDYRYNTSFLVNSADAGAIVINGNWASDNVGALLLNGSSAGVTGNPNQGFTEFTAFSLTGLRNGLNTLDFTVNNASASPTGMRVEFTTQFEQTTPTLGQMVFHPSAPHAWVSSPSLGTVRLFDTASDQFTFLETPTGKGARDLALSTDGARLYAGNLEAGAVSVLDTSALDVLASIATPGPAGLQMTSDNTALLVANFFTDTIAIIDPDQNQVIAHDIAAGKGSDSFAVIETQPRMLYRAFVASQSANSVTALDLQTAKTLASLPVGQDPTCIAITPDLLRIGVCNAVDGTFQVFDTDTYSSRGVIPILQSPAWIAVSLDGRRAYVASGGESKMAVVDLSTLQVETILPVHDTAHSVVLFADGKKGYLIHTSSVSVFSINPLAVTQVIAAPGAPQNMALHPSLPRAFISFPPEGTVREFDTNTEQFTGLVIKTGLFTQDLAFSPDGARLYACNLHDNTVSVIDVAVNQVTATIPTSAGPKSPVFTSDGSILVITTYFDPTITLIDPIANRVLGTPIPCPAFPNSLVLRGAPQQDEALPPVPVEVTIDVPAGSSSIEVTWIGEGSLRGSVSKPPGRTKEVVASSGAAWKLDARLGVSIGGSPSPGIDQIRLRSDSAWTLARVCLTRLKLAGGLAEQQRLNDALNHQVALWQKPTVLLAPGPSYTLQVYWSAEARGMGDLNGWSAAFHDHTTLNFQTALPPSLGVVSDPNSPPKAPPEGTGLLDLSLYVRRTIPVTETPSNQVPELTKPVFRGYDITVEFNENYADQMYQMAGRDLDLVLFDRNNQPVRDANGTLIIMEDAWENAPQLVLTQTEARWIDMFNANTCHLQAIDPTLIPTSRVLKSKDAHVLAPDTVYEARLIPRLARQLKISDSPNTATWNPPPSVKWTDYRVTALARLDTPDQATIVFRSGAAGYYAFTIDPKLNTRQLTLVQPTATKPLASDLYVYHPGTDAPFRIHIEAIGPNLIVSQDGVVVFSVNDSTLADGGCELRWAAGQSVFQDFGLNDLGANAPVAYHFDFTTSIFTNFYHLIHSFEDELWRASLTAAQIATPVAQAVEATQPISDAEIRAYDQVASLALGQASAQDPPQVEVTRVEDGAAILGWLLRSPQPIDWKRTQIDVETTARALAIGQAPTAVKITEAELGDPESVTVLAREQTDFSAYSVEYLQMPGALDEAARRRSLSALFHGAFSVVGVTGWETGSDGLSLKALDPSAYGNIILQARVRRDGAGTTGLLFRYSDKDHHYRLLFTDNELRLERVAPAAVTPLWKGPPLAPARFCDIAVSLQGSVIRVFRDSVLACEVADGAVSTGGVGICAAGSVDLPSTLAQLSVPNLAVYPSTIQFSDWSFEDDFTQLSTDTWRFVDEGDQSGPSRWQAASGRLLQTSAIADSSSDPARKRGTLALLNNFSLTGFRCVTRLLSNRGAAIGMVFGYQDSANFYRFSIDAQAGYRRLARSVQGDLKILWQDSGPVQAGHDYACTLDVTDEYVAGWLDGEQVFRWTVSEAITGSIGLYCSGNPDASFGPVRIGAPSWIPYYTFGSEAPLSAGNRIKIVSAAGVVAPNLRTSIRRATELDDPPSERLPANGAQLRVLAPDGAVRHRREFIPSAEFTQIAVNVLRAADGTGMFFAPISQVVARQPVRWSLRYRRDNTAADPASVLFTEVGESADELVTIDAPADVSNVNQGVRLRIAQLVDGGGWKTTILLVNADSIPAAFTVTFHQPDGTPGAFPLEGAGVVIRYSDVIPVGGSRTIDTQGQAADLIQGWADIESGGFISGAAVIRQRFATNADAEASVRLRESTKHFLLPFDNTRGFTTALAILNPDATQAASVAIVLRDENGQLISHESLTLGAITRKAFALPAQFPKSADQRGVAELTSAGPELIALGLLFSPKNSFTSIEPIAMDALPAPGTNAGIAQIVDGGGWQTTIILTNTTSSPAPFSLKFTQPDDSPWSVAVAGTNGVTEYAGAVPAGGSKTIETSGASADLSQGWGQLITSGSIAGMIILRQKLSADRDSQCAAPLSFTPIRRFLLPFDNTQGFVTAMAMANQDPSQSTVIAVTLRNADGQVIESETLSLAARGASK